VVKIDFDSHTIEDNKTNIQGYIKQLNNLKNNELADCVDSQGNRMEHKPTFLLLNQYSSKPEGQEWNTKLRDQVDSSPRKLRTTIPNEALLNALREYCARNSWNFVHSSEITMDSRENQFSFNSENSENNAKNNHVRTFLNQIHKQLLTIGTQPRDLGMESQFIMKETNAEELEKMIEVYRKEAANASTKVSIFDGKNAKESLIKLRSFKNDDAMKKIL
jgi:hypothetical protein